MSPLTNLDIANKILDVLNNDPTLAGYVKKFSVGTMPTAVKMFPFIAVEAPEIQTEPLTMGPDGYVINRYTIKIFGGMHHMLPQVAHAGNESTGKKGILQLNSDILNTVIPNDFDGAFAAPVKLLSSNMQYKQSTGGRTWITQITLSGFNKSLKTKNI